MTKVFQFKKQLCPIIIIIIFNTCIQRSKTFARGKTPIMYWRNPSLDNVVPPDDPLDEFAIANESKNLFFDLCATHDVLIPIRSYEPEARNLVECDEPAHFTTLFELYEDFADSRFLCQIIELFKRLRFGVA